MPRYHRVSCLQLHQQDRPKVVYVGARGSRDHEVAERAKEAITVVRGKHLSRINAARARPSNRVAARLILARRRGALAEPLTVRQWTERFNGEASNRVGKGVHRVASVKNDMILKGTQ